MAWRRTLKLAMIWRLVLGMGAPILVVAIVSHQYMVNQTTRSIHAHNAVLAEALAKQGNAYLREPLNAMAQTADLLSRTAIDDAVEPLLENLVRTNDYFESVYLLDRAGQTTHVALAAPLAGREEDFLDIDLSGQPFFAHWQRHPGPCWSQAFLSPVTGGLSITLSLEAGDQLLVGNFSIARLANLSDGAMAEGMGVAILDNHGTMFFHTDPALSNQALNLRTLGPVKRALGGTLGTHPYELGGEPYIGTVARIEQTGWLVMVSQNQRAAYAPARQVHGLFLVGTLCAMLVAVGMAYWLSASAAEPLQLLDRSAQSLAHGDYDVTIPRQRYDETEQLAAAFRHMTAAIAQREQQLQRTQQAIEFITEQTAHHTGDDFFKSVTRSVAQSFGVGRVTIAEWLGDPPVTVHPLAVWDNGTTSPANDHPLAVSHAAALLEQPLVHADARTCGDHYLAARLTDSAGRITGHLELCNDQPIDASPGTRQIIQVFAARIGAELERVRNEQAMRESEQRYRATFEQAAVGIANVDLDGRYVRTNTTLQNMLGYTGEALAARTFADVTHPDDVADDHCAVEALMTGRISVHRREKRYLRKNGQVMWGNLSAALMRDEQGQPQYFVIIVEDITERKRDEQRLRLLMRELDHRVKNALASVLGIVEQTLRTSGTPESFAAAIRGRVSAMAQAHELLTQTKWQGMDLAEAVRRAIEPFITEHRITVEGPKLLLPERTAQPVCLVLHELATNAIKHGALSQSGGKLDIRWTRDDPRSTLELVWTESDGPPTAAPAQPGMGTRLIHGLIAYELHGEVELDYRPDGLRCTLGIPLGDDFAAGAPRA